MKNTIRNIAHIVCAGGIVGFLTFTSMVTVAHAKVASPAGTIISGTFETDMTWTREASPYILDGDVTIKGPYTLTMEPGVSVTLATERLNMSTAIFVTDGTIKINGSADDHVKLSGIDKIHIINGQADVAYADMTTRGPGLLLYWSDAKIATSTFSESSGGGLYFRSSRAEIVDSQIINNSATGIYITADDQGEQRSQVKIRNSIIKNNGSYSIQNSGTNIVNAENNWWGTADGPVEASLNISTATSTTTIQGSVSYSPWLTEEPDLSTRIKCCSSILFIPGLEASRLYRPETNIMGIGSSINQLWEPNRNGDVKKLFLDQNGSSTDPSIYSGEPIDRALGIKDVYGSFMDFLDGMVEGGSIGEWKSFGYDWRKPIAEVVAGRENRATSTDSLIETIQDLASRSRTKKVTLVAHSNGGLVAKYLVKTLQDIGKSNLIDTVISVAVPYLGTPQAISALLQGDNQSIGYGTILKQSVAKELGLNMPSAYSLIPSTQYFSKVFGPTIVFASTSSGTSANQINTATAQDLFISSRANSLLMTAARVIHGVLDPFVWPANIARWAVVGWGNKTTKTFVYSGNSYKNDSTSLGDGTVVVPSAAYNSGTTTAVNLRVESEQNRSTINHSNILGSASVKNVIENIIRSTTGASKAGTSPSIDYQTLEKKLSQIPNVTLGEPDYSKEETFLVLSTHSPVDLHVYDQYGNHTGLTTVPAGLDVEEDLYIMFEEKILGSSFEIHDDNDQHETYITLPNNSGQKYNVSINGVGVGEFTYQVERVKGTQVLDVVEYSSLPVTPLMTASSTIVSDVSGSTNSTYLASSSSALSIDVDGNGSVDITSVPNFALDPITFFESLKNTLIQLLGPGKASDDFTRRINKIEDAYKKNRLKAIDSGVNNLKSRINSKNLKTLTQSDKDEIVAMIDSFIAQFE